MAVNSQWFVSHFPPIAIRTVKNTASVELFYSTHLRKLVDQPSSKDKFSAGGTHPVALQNFETVFVSLGVNYFDGPKLYCRILSKLFASNRKKLLRRNSVPGKETVQTPRRSITRLASITH